MTEPYHTDNNVTLHHGDCLAALQAMPDNSVDSIVTDPPYGLSAATPQQVADTITAWATGDRTAAPTGKGFMGRSWDAFVPPPAVWDECLRVLKPGGHMLVFAGSRTQDLMGLSIRLAGFELRDSLAWIYGSGFPKSMDVSKAIDKARDDRGDILRVTSWLAEQRDRAGKTNRDIDAAFGTAGMAGHWTSTKSQPAVPKWEQWQTLRELLDLPDDMDAEVWRLNGRKGTPGENWDKREVIGQRNDGASSIYSMGENKMESNALDITAPATPEAERWAGWGTALKPAIEPILCARKPLAGTVAANVLEWGTGALNIDASRVGHNEPTKMTQRTAPRYSGAVMNGGVRGGDQSAVASASPAGRWPANVLLDPEAAAAMDEQSGNVKGAVSNGRTGASRGYDGGHGGQHQEAGYADSGGASRFFPVFKYQAKAPKRERPVIEREDGTKVQHCTVKPLALMSWLVTLVTPPGGVVLDPFAGSGTTLQAARDKGFRSVGVEADADHCELIVARLSKDDGGLFAA